MKKIFGAFIPLLLISLVAATVSFAATVTLHASVNNGTGKVDISGNISSGADQQVTVLVISPGGTIDYIDQTTSGVDGSYQFSYTVHSSNKGIYQVSVGGTGVNEVSKATFEYEGRSSADTADETENGVQITPGTTSIVKVVRQDGTDLTKVKLDTDILGKAFGVLKNKDKGAQTVTIEVPIEGAVSLELVSETLNTAIKSGLKAVISVQTPSGYYDIPLQELKGKMNGKDSVVFNFDNAADSIITEISKQVASENILTVMTFNLTMLKNGKVEEVNNLNKPFISRGIILPETVNLENTKGVLFNTKTKKITYVPTVINHANGQSYATIQLDGNSIYGVVELEKQPNYNVSSKTVGDYELLKSY